MSTEWGSVLNSAEWGECHQHLPGSGDSGKAWVPLLAPQEPAVSLTEAIADWEALSVPYRVGVFLYTSSRLFS